MIILEETTEKICIWKGIAERGIEKMIQGRDDWDLDLSKPCYDCDGKNKNCKYYAVV